MAQTLSRFRARKVAVGAVTSMGATVPARRWVIARTRVAGERATSITVMNPNVNAVHIAVQIVHDGIVDRLVDLQHLTVDHNTSLVLPPETGGATHQHDAAVVITADAPIFATSTMYAQRDATRPAGIPTR